MKRLDINHIDWSKPNKQLAIETGFSIQTISQNRHKCFPRLEARDEEVFAKYPEIELWINLIRNNQLENYIKEDFERARKFHPLRGFADSLLLQTNVVELQIKQYFQRKKFKLGKSQPDYQI